MGNAPQITSQSVEIETKLNAIIYWELKYPNSILNYRRKFPKSQIIRNLPDPASQVVFVLYMYIYIYMYIWFIEKFRMLGIPEISNKGTQGSQPTTKQSPLFQ